jgi:hypothetical protein
MNLSGVANPITLAAGNISTPFKWIPSAPIHLPANECYWVVFSVDSGAIAYQAATFSMPAGDAATFGRSSSANRGASWVVPDLTSNWKMLIQGTPSASKSPPLAISFSGTDAAVVLSWPMDATGFTLQSTTKLVSPAVWSAVSPAPVVVNGNYAVTNRVSGAQTFYRLIQ